MKYEITYEYHYEDSETVTVFAEDEVEANKFVVVVLAYVAVCARISG